MYKIKMISKINFPYILSIIFLFAFATFIPTIYASQVDSNEFPAILQISPSENKSKFGYIILSTKIINADNSNKQPSDFTINIMGTHESPSSFKAVPSPQLKIIPIMEGHYKISISDVKDFEIFLGEQCEGIMNFGEVKSCVIRADYIKETDISSFNTKSTVSPLSLQDLLLPPELIEKDQHNKLKIAQIPKPSDTSKVGFLLLSTKVINNNGGNKQPSDFTINIDGTPAFPSSFKAAPSNLIQVVSLTEGQYSVLVNNVPGYKEFFDLQCTGQINPGEIKNCLIKLDDIAPPISCPPNQHFDTATNTCIPNTPQPPPPPPSGGVFPVQNVIWYYDSQLALSKDITIPSKQTPPNDPVLLSSGASGVKSHSVKNGWLEVQSGGGNGRVYWNYHESPQFSQLPTAGFNTVMTGTFMLKPGIDNLSIKDGNHGTDGWSLDGQYVFGGFGLSIHRDEIQSKVEYWHNDQGNELSFPYPNGIKLVDNKEYKFFLTIRTDRTNQQVVLNAWLDFGDGKGWVHVAKDRKWGQNGWDPGKVPNGKDKEQIEKGPSSIKKHHIWTRANGNAFLPIKDIKIGTIDYIS
jgi:hypothetical protein